MAKFLEKQIPQLAKAVAKEEIPAAERRSTDVAVEPRRSVEQAHAARRTGRASTKARSARSLDRQGTLGLERRAARRARGAQSRLDPLSGTRSASARFGRSPAPSSTRTPARPHRRCGLRYALRARTRNETRSEKERLDRNLEQLLGELRVAAAGCPGPVRVPARRSVQPALRGHHAASSSTATSSPSCLAAGGLRRARSRPPRHHRIEFRKQDKKRIVMGGNRLDDRGLRPARDRHDRGDHAGDRLPLRLDHHTVAATLVALLFAVLWYAVPLASPAPA